MSACTLPLFLQSKWEKTQKLSASDMLCLHTYPQPLLATRMTTIASTVIHLPFVPTPSQAAYLLLIPTGLYPANLKKKPTNNQSTRRQEKRDYNSTSMGAGRTNDDSLPNKLDSQETNPFRLKEPNHYWPSTHAPKAKSAYNESLPHGCHGMLLGKWL